MAKIKQAKRRQRLPDAAFIQASRTKLAFFITDKTRFISLDSDFDDPFAANWQAQIDAAEAEPTKKNISDLSIQLTQAMEEQMELCRAKWSDAKYYIKKAFPKNPEMLNAFGNSRFRRARKVPRLMVTFMNVFGMMCNNHRAALNANGYTNDDIAQIDTLTQDLEAISITQQNLYQPYHWPPTSALPHII